MGARVVKAVSFVAAIAALAVLPAVSAKAAGVDIKRVAGQDRYDTAAQVSASTFGVGAPVAFIATGENFPDALAAAAASAHQGGPVLLAQLDAIPQPTQDELDRLQPKKIVIVGGSGVIDDNVEQQLQDFTDGDVIRIDGDSRYDTAAALSNAAFPTASVVFIATGDNFPDALSAGPAAGQVAAPVLLVPGSGPIPSSVADELTRLHPSSIIVLGGTNVIHHDVLVSIHNTVPSAQIGIIAGETRFTTAVTVSQAEFANADSVLLATGRNFPDALAAGGAGGIAKAPLLLVDTNCVPPQVKAELLRLNPSHVIVVGGPSAVGAGVLNGNVCTGDQPGHFSFDDNGVLIGSLNVPAGTYRTRAASAGCQWARFSGPDLNNDGITGDANDGPGIVTLKSTDYEFLSDSCATWTNDLSPITSSPTADFGDGNWFVGSDIASGTWTAPGGSDCTWIREKSFGGEESDAIDFDSGALTNPSVAIAPTDAGFETSGCGTWTKTG